MVQSSYKQHLKVAAGPQARPTFINSKAGHVAIGAGSIATPQASKPSYVQYLPAPTKQGQDIGNIVSQHAGHLGKIAEQIADSNATSEAKLELADLQQQLREVAYSGQDGRGGILVQNGVKFMNSKDSAKERLQEMVNSRAEQMEPRVQAKFLDQAMQNLRVVNNQIDAKYLLEYADLQKKAVEADFSTHMVNAVDAAKPGERRQAVISAYTTLAEQNALLTGQDLTNSIDQAALTSTYKDLVNRLSVYPDGPARLEEYAELFGTIDDLTKQEARDIFASKAARDLARRTMAEKVADKRMEKQAEAQIAGSVQKVADAAPEDRPAIIVEMKQAMSYLFPTESKEINSLNTALDAFDQGHVTNAKGQIVLNDALEKGTSWTDVAASLQDDTTIADSDKKAIIASSKSNMRGILKADLETLFSMFADRQRIKIGINPDGSWSPTDNKDLPVFSAYKAEVLKALSPLMAGSRKTYEAKVEELKTKANTEDATGLSNREPHASTIYFSSVAMTGAKDNNPIAWVGPPGADKSAPLVLSTYKQKDIQAITRHPSYVKFAAGTKFEGQPIDDPEFMEAEAAAAGVHPAYLTAAILYKLALTDLQKRIPKGSPGYAENRAKLLEQRRIMEQGLKAPGGLYDGSN